MTILLSLPMRLSSFFAAFFAGVASLESLESSLTGFVEGATVVEADELEAAVDVVAICAPELLLGTSRHSVGRIVYLAIQGFPVTLRSCIARIIRIFGRHWILV